MSRKTGDYKKEFLPHIGGMNGIGHTIKVLREAVNLTQEGLAKALGVSRAAVSAWENGANLPRGKRLKKLADTLNTSPAQLVSGEALKGRPPTGMVIAVESGGGELPLVDPVSIAPTLWAMNRQPVIVIEDKSGRRFGILATAETIQSLSDCLSVLRELL